MIHDIIKIRYSQEGFLPDYPPHLISDQEMLDAFILESTRPAGTYFESMYPNMFESLDTEYKALYECIVNNIQAYLDAKIPEIPDWIYSYMLGAVITFDSPILDRHDLLVLLGCDNIDDIFTEEAASACCKISKEAIMKQHFKSDEDKDKDDKLPFALRVPTIFGEPNVIKLLRVSNSDVSR